MNKVTVNGANVWCKCDHYFKQWFAGSLEETKVKKENNLIKQAEKEKKKRFRASGKQNKM